MLFDPLWMLFDLLGIFLPFLDVFFNFPLHFQLLRNSMGIFEISCFFFSFHSLHLPHLFTFSISLTFVLSFPL